MQTELGSKTRISLPPDPAELIQNHGRCREYDVAHHFKSAVGLPVSEVPTTEVNELTHRVNCVCTDRERRECHIVVNVLDFGICP